MISLEQRTELLSLILSYGDVKLLRGVFVGQQDFEIAEEYHKNCAEKLDRIKGLLSDITELSLESTGN